MLDFKIGTMPIRRAASLLALNLFFLLPRVHAETGEAGWLRYAVLPPQAAQQYSKVPHLIVVTGQSTVAQNAANELARGLHSMLSQNLQISSTLPGTGADAFLLGTSAEIQHLAPDWKPPSPIAPEGFSLSQTTLQGHNYWVLAGGTDRGELYGVFHVLEQVAQGRPLAPDNEAPSSSHSLGQPVGQLRRKHRARLWRAQHFLRQRPCPE